MAIQDPPCWPFVEYYINSIHIQYWTVKCMCEVAAVKHMYLLCAVPYPGSQLYPNQDHWAYELIVMSTFNRPQKLSSRAV